MGLQQRLELRQGQSLVMTPQLLQAIKLLQLSHLDLVSYVDAELERNPLLEVAAGAGDADVAPGERDGVADPSLLASDLLGDSDSFGFDAGASAEGWSPGEIEGPRGVIESDGSAPLDNIFPDDAMPARGGDGIDQLSLAASSWQGSGGSFDAEPFDVTATLASEESLHEHLAAQLHLATGDPVWRLVGRHLIDAVNEAGYLAEDPADLAERLGVGARLVLQVLALVQTFAPSGIAARDLAECLAIQLAERDRYDPAMRAMVGRLDLVAKRDLATLKRLCGVDDEDLAAMLAELRELEPKPGRAFGSGPVHVLVPDVFVRPAPDGSWLVELNPDTLPRVLVNQAFHARVSKNVKNDAEKSYISECLQSANWLTRSLEQRSKTILKVASEIVRQQDGFFLKGVSQLRPLNLKTIADAIGMHESTVSRVTSNKSIGTGRGTFEMKYFFTASIPGAAGMDAHSSEAVRHRIRQLVDAERPVDVLSDDALVKKLMAEGIDIARRTVAKYRESLRIPSSVDRRREKARRSMDGSRA